MTMNRRLSRYCLLIPAALTVVVELMVWCLPLAHGEATPDENDPAEASGYAKWQNGPSKDAAFFPIAVWLQDPRNAAKYQALGVNLYIGLWEGPTAGQIAELKRHHMPVICEQNDYALKHLDEKTFVGWMHGDEPHIRGHFAGSRNIRYAGRFHRHGLGTGRHLCTDRQRRFLPQHGRTRPG
jgi:hypothetical protein